MQGELADTWKENIIENLENESLEFAPVEEFLMDLKKEFGEEDNKIIKVAELKKVEQRNRMMKKFLQKFRKAAKRSGYKERLLMEEFSEI